MNRFFKTIIMLISLAPAAGYAQSHALVNSMRSGSVNHLFVSQYTTFEVGRANTGQSSNTFQGAGIGTATGTEIMKFVQISAGHTFLSLKNKSDSHERLLGSRLNVTLGLVFSSPMGNLEFGAGPTVAKYDYINPSQSGEIYTRGTNYSLSGNRFLSSKVSVFARACQSSEKSADVRGIEAFGLEYDASSISIGFSIWF